MRFARWVFTIAPIWGVLVLVPLYFMEDMTARLDPPAITHPEYYYGFVGVALVWQAAYFLCGRDPVRYRPFMLLCAAAKASWAATALTLFLAGRASSRTLAAAVPDALFMVLFVVSYARTPRSWNNPPEGAST